MAYKNLAITYSLLIFSSLGLSCRNAVESPIEGNWLICSTVGCHAMVSISNNEFSNLHGCSYTVVEEKTDQFMVEAACDQSVRYAFRFFRISADAFHVYDLSPSNLAFQSANVYIRATALDIQRLGLAPGREISEALRFSSEEERTEVKRMFAELRCRQKCLVNCR